MNTLPKSIRILCFGDSNTWGYIPATKHSRYASNIRWTGVLQNALGAGYDVLEEGLNSRTICTNDPRPDKEGRNGLEYLIPCLDTHDPIDLLIIMLGTNELKEDYNFSVRDIAEMMRMCIKTILDRPSQTGHPSPKIILLSPPHIDQTAERCRPEYGYVGCTEKSIELGQAYAAIAKDMAIHHVDAGNYTLVGSDGVHITEVSHQQLGNALHKTIRELVGV
jgi:lysophospholipase L1-like esterase